MDWADDLKLTLKKSAKKGRRAAAALLQNNNNTPSSSSEQENVSFEKSEPPQTDSLTNLETLNQEIKKDISKSKKIGGWAATDNDVVNKLGRNKSNTNLIEQERFNTITKVTNLSDDDIPIIPDLDDIQDELILNEMVEAPTISVNRVATYTELNSDLLKQGSFATLEDIDLSILGKCLQSENVLNEPDEIWTWDQLFILAAAEIEAAQIEDKQTQFVH